jgi:hypothetical protein
MRSSRSRRVLARNAMTPTILMRRSNNNLLPSLEVSPWPTKRWSPMRRTSSNSLYSHKRLKFNKMMTNPISKRRKPRNSESIYYSLYVIKENIKINITPGGTFYQS